MTVLSDGQWRLIESAYLNSTETIASISERFGISPATIHSRRIKYGWAPRRAGAIKKAAEPTAAGLSDKAALIARFYRLINLKLEHLEEDMARSNERTPADNERETRALGTLIRNYEKVSGLEQDGGDDGKQDGNGPEHRAEAEAIRRELAQRLVRLRQAEQGDSE
jgi:transposase-like protein